MLTDDLKYEMMAMFGLTFRTAGDLRTVAAARLIVNVFGRWMTRQQFQCLSGADTQVFYYKTGDELVGFVRYASCQKKKRIDMFHKGVVSAKYLGWLTTAWSDSFMFCALHLP